MSPLGGFHLENQGAKLILPEGSQRLLAFLALKGRSIGRPVVAGTLWPAATEDHASSSLRAALARLHGGARAAVEATAQEIGLSDEVTVDLWDSRELAHKLLAPEGSTRAAAPSADAISALSEEVLPDWYDEWVLLEAEDWRQLRLHALEALAERLTARQKYGDAAAAALAAVRAEPLRESPRAALIRVHIAEGNPFRGPPGVRQVRRAPEARARCRAHRAAGLCNDCSEPVYAGTSKCEKHLKSSRAYDVPQRPVDLVTYDDLDWNRHDGYNQFEVLRRVKAMVASEVRLRSRTEGDQEITSTPAPCSRSERMCACAAA